MKNKFIKGQVLRHVKSQSIWIIIETFEPDSKPAKYWGKTITIVGNCLYSGRPLNCEYWKPGQNDTWLVDVDNDGKTKYFSDQWEILVRA
jgi:hypothetical protein